MNHSLGFHRVVPRAIGGRRVFAATDSAAVIAQLSAAFEDFKKRHDGRDSAVQSALDGMEARIAALQAGGSVVGAASRPVDAGYTSIYASWFRNGAGEREIVEANRTGERAQIQAAMSAGANEAGGYLAPVEWDRTIIKALRSVSPMRRLATVIPTTVRGYTSVWNLNQWGSGWVGEAAPRPVTTNTQLASVPYLHGEIYANPAITQQLLDDADFNIEQWLADEVAEEFAAQEGIAFISGNGVNKPQGLLTYTDTEAPIHPGGALTVVPSGAAATLVADGLIDFVYKLPAPYRQNARWLMASTTAAVIRKMKDGQDNYLWQPATVAGQPDTLLGFPVEMDENMPAVAANALPIAFGDFKRGYVINDRTGSRVLRDPYTNKPYVNFYTTKRVGGGVRDPKAIILMKVAAA